MINTDSVADRHVPVADGMPVYSGDTAIAGVPGTAARDPARLRRHRRRVVWRAAPDRPCRRHDRRHRRDAHRQRDAGRRAARRRPRRHRLRGTGRARGERAAAVAPRGHPPAGRQADEPRRRDVDHRSEAHARRPATRRRIDQHPDVHPPPRPRRDRRARRGLGGDGRPAPRFAGQRRARRRARRARGGRAPDRHVRRLDRRHVRGRRHARGRAGRHHPHGAQADGRRRLPREY